MESTETAGELSENSAEDSLKAFEDAINKAEKTNVAEKKKTRVSKGREKIEARQDFLAGCKRPNQPGGLRKTPRLRMT